MKLVKKGIAERYEYEHIEEKEAHTKAMELDGWSCENDGLCMDFQNGTCEIFAEFVKYGIKMFTFINKN